MVNRRTGHVLAMALVALACLPTSAPAQEKALKETQAFTHNDINVIVSPSANDLVTVIFGLEGGVLTGETDNPTLSEFASDLITSSGSASISKEELRRFTSRTSTQLYGAGDLRGMQYRMTATRHHFDEAWEILASLVKAPAFDTLEFRNIMQARTAAARRRWAQPEAYAHLIADSLLKMGHPVLSRHTLPENVEAVTIPLISDYIGKITERTRMLVVVVGRVTPREIREKLKLLGDLPRGSYKAVQAQPIPPVVKPEIVVVERPNSPTTYVAASFVGPDAKNEDYWPLLVGFSHLRNRLFEEVRTKRNLSYAPQSYMSSTMGQGHAFMAVSSVLPDSAFAVMYEELRKMKRGDFGEKELEESKQVFLTGFYLGRSTNEDKATALFNTQRNAGDWRRALNFQLIEGVTKAQVQRAFDRWAHDLHVGIVGDVRNVTTAKYKF